MASFNRPTTPEKLITWAGQLVRDLTRQVRYVSFGSATLTTSATTTIVRNSAIRPQAPILLQPQTAEAAADIATVFVDPASVVLGRFAITHSSNNTTNRVFSYTVFEPKESTR